MTKTLRRAATRRRGKIGRASGDAAQAQILALGRGSVPPANTLFDKEKPPRPTGVSEARTAAEEAPHNLLSEMSMSSRRSEGRDAGTRSKADPRASRQARSRSTSRGDPPDPDDSDLARLYDQLFSTPTLGPSALEVTAALESFARVFEVAKDRPAVARAAVRAAEPAFFRGGHPFDYQISESAATVGGQSA